VTDDTPNEPAPAAPMPEPPPDVAEAAAPSSDGDRVPGTPSSPSRTSSSADIRKRRPDYKGAELDPERGPGLGCFWFQVIVLAFFIVLIPLVVNLAWPYEVLAILLFVVIGLLLLTGQTVIFLLRLVAADRRAQGRRRPLASPTKTVGELEDEHRVAHAVGSEAPSRAVRVTPEPMTGAGSIDSGAGGATALPVADQARAVVPGGGASHLGADADTGAKAGADDDAGVKADAADAGADADADAADAGADADADAADAGADADADAADAGADAAAGADADQADVGADPVKVDATDAGTDGAGGTLAADAAADAAAAADDDAAADAADAAIDVAADAAGAADAAIDVAADAADAADGTRGAAPPEEPDPGVRQ
jgi:hypothetical protein